MVLTCNRACRAASQKLSRKAHFRHSQAQIGVHSSGRPSRYKSLQMSGLNVYLEVINGFKISSEFILLAEKVRKQKKSSTA